MKKCKITLSDVAAKLLILGLTIILIYLVYITCAILSETNTASYVLSHLFAPQLEHIFMSLFLIVVGSLLLDISIKEIKKE